MLLISARYVRRIKEVSPEIKRGEATTMTKGAHPSSSFGVKCVQCSNELIAPERSEYWNERHVSHLWHCPKCDCCFETAIFDFCRLVEDYHGIGRYFAAAARCIGQIKGSKNRTHSASAVLLRGFRAA
jgi:hypothetical protein